jgi:hypothetical protein
MRGPAVDFGNRDQRVRVPAGNSQPPALTIELAAQSRPETSFPNSLPLTVARARRSSTPIPRCQDFPLAVHSLTDAVGDVAAGPCPGTPNRPRTPGQYLRRGDVGADQRPDNRAAATRDKTKTNGRTSR